MNVLNVDWWISWITDSKQCRREHGGQNYSTSRTDQGIVRWDEIFHIFPFRKVAAFEMGIWKFVDGRLSYTTFRAFWKMCGLPIALSLTKSHTSAPSIRPLLSIYAFTTLGYRVSQKLTPFYRVVWVSEVFRCIIGNFVSLLCSLIEWCHHYVVLPL